VWWLSLTERVVMSLRAENALASTGAGVYARLALEFIYF